MVLGVRFLTSVRGAAPEASGSLTHALLGEQERDR